MTEQKREVSLANFPKLDELEREDNSPQEETEARLEELDNFHNEAESWKEDFELLLHAKLAEIKKQHRQALETWHKTDNIHSLELSCFFNGQRKLLKEILGKVKKP